MKPQRSVKNGAITTNEELAALEKENDGDATQVVRSAHIVELNAKVADKVKALTPQVKLALKIDDDNVAALTARLLVLENPGVL